MRKYKNDDGSRYYAQNVQVNNFKAEGLFSAPINILEGQLAKIDDVIQSRYMASMKACDLADKIACRVSTFKLQISRDGIIVDKYILKFVTQLELEQVKMEQLKLQEIISTWRDISPFIMKRLEVEKQLAEERSKLEIIAGDALPRNVKRGKHGTLPNPPDI